MVYEHQNKFEEALYLFCNRIDVICAMEMSNKIDPETAYKNIKTELKELKKVRKKLNKETWENENS